MSSFDWLNKKIFRNRKLSTVLSILIWLWLVLAVTLIGSSLNLSWRLEDKGVAINDAGSLRKRVFHLLLLSEKPLNSKQLVYEKQDFLLTLKKLEKSIKDNSLNQQDYMELIKQTKNIRKSFFSFWQEISIEGMSDAAKQLSTAEEFVENINLFVATIEERNTLLIVRLRWFQYLLIVMSVISAFATIYLLRQLVVYPLQRLNAGISSITNGDLHTKLLPNDSKEFNQVVAGFNNMSDNLSAMYDNLEHLVTQKTEELQAKNYELAILYKFSFFLQKSDDLDFTLLEFLKRMVNFTGGKAAVFKLLNSDNQMETAASFGMPKNFDHTSNCAKCKSCRCKVGFSDKSFQLLDSDSPALTEVCLNVNFEFVSLFQIKTVAKQLGILCIYFSEGTRLDEHYAKLIEVVCGQLAITIERFNFNELNRQIAVQEERNYMAQGLHDSIAQSLSFLNMQTQLLQKGLANQNKSMIDKSLGFIKEGLDQCYEDVRELLSNFRMRLTKGDFSDNAKRVVDNFIKQSRVPTRFQIFGQVNNLDMQEQLQIVFILQEALSNIRKHARATMVKVEIVSDERHFALSISDDGVGFVVNQTEKKNGHFGTEIMKERAAKLNAELLIDSQINKGTTVKLSYLR